MVGGHVGKRENNNEGKTVKSCGKNELLLTTKSRHFRLTTISEGSQTQTLVGRARRVFRAFPSDVR
jgi:hypothetical protein